MNKLTIEEFNNLEAVGWKLSLPDQTERDQFKDWNMIEMLRYFSGNNESLDYILDHHVFMQIKKIQYDDQTWGSGTKLSFTAWLEPKHATYFRLRLNNNNEEIR